MNKYQEALDLLSNTIKDNLISFDDTEKKAVETLQELVDKVNNWISVEERLPKEKGVYLVSYHPCYWENVNEEICVGIDTFMGKTSWSKRKYQRVIAWMPLPEPYKRSDEDEN